MTDLSHLLLKDIEQLKIQLTRIKDSPISKEIYLILIKNSWHHQSITFQLIKQDQNHQKELLTLTIGSFHYPQKLILNKKEKLFKKITKLLVQALQQER